jgi:hypothetical protein
VTRHLRAIGLAVAVALGTGSIAAAQTQAEKDAQAEAAKKSEAAAKETQQREAERIRQAEERRRLVPLSIELVVSRYQGEKKISSLPYSLAVNANDSAPGGVCQLRMGARVPVPSIVAPKPNPNSPGGPMPGPVNYQEIGTNIDCSARTLDDGRFQLRITVEDTSVYTNIQDTTTPTVEQMPVFRTFRSTNTLVLRDGQARDFNAAADRVSGEVVRIGVTLRVVK